MRIVLFDIDGTLVSSGGAGKAAMEAALASTFGAPPTSDGVPFSGRTDRAIGVDLFRRHGIEHTPESWQRFLAAYLGHLPTCLASHRGAVLPGIAGLLQQLAGSDDIALGLLTGNIRDGARIKLGHFKLFHYFAFGGFGDHHLHRDDVAREALAVVAGQFAGMASEQMWVIGDTPLDVQCARAIGARVAAVATGIHTLDELAGVKPDLLLADFSEPGALFKVLL